MDRFRKHLPTMVVAAVTAMVTAGVPALAGSVVSYARNADKVDGKHAVGFSASIAGRAGKLVATNAAGRLPNDIIAKAPDADQLDGVDSDGFVEDGETVAEATHAASADAATNATNASSANNANLLDGIDSTSFMRRAIYRVTVASTGTCPNPDACFLRVDCDFGDALLSGGFDSLDSGTRLIATRPGKDLSNSQPTAFGWVVWWDNNATEDTVEVTITCANNN
jgi:hypothetical protein